MTTGKWTKAALEAYEKEFLRSAGAAGPLMYRIAEETDAGAAVMAACALDYLLERLLRASYIDDPKVKSLFQDDRLLQSFHAKVNIAYFSGLIPDKLYHDLKLIGQIRNRFAHTIVADLAFTDPTVTAMVDKLILGYEVPHRLTGPRWRFRLCVYGAVSTLFFIGGLVRVSKPPHLVDTYGANRWDWSEPRLTESEIDEILHNISASAAKKQHRSKSTRVRKMQSKVRRATARLEHPSTLAAP